MGRKCTVCSSGNLRAVDKAIREGGTYRGIAAQYKIGVSSMLRHTENCLGLTLSAITKQRGEKSAINVYQEFEANLAFASKLRIAAEEYLADPIDPLQMKLQPFAHEVDIAYFDWSDLEGEGGDAKPKKKTAKLSMLIADAEKVRNFEVDRITIKTVDLRSWALDAIKTVDLCVDRFARLAGEYQKDQDNAKTLKDTLGAIQTYLNEHPEADREKVIHTFAVGRNVPADKIAENLGIIG
jgi:hypothetical protein